MTATTAAPVTGITEELGALIAGGWEDDDSDSSGWMRRLLNGDWDGDVDGRRIRQRVFPASDSLGWIASIECEMRKNTWVNSLEEALKWCEDRTENYKVVSAYSSAAKQEDRFAKLAAYVAG